MQEDPLIGRVLDRRYEIVARIERGGMATVYEAHDRRLDRTVAVKVMHQGMGDDAAFAARFVREAHSAARLTHPNVVAVYDQGDDHGTVFLAMEYVPGQTLRDTITREAPMSPSRALRLVDPILAALAAAHRAGIVHRDVKPENVLIARDGTVKVADFGLARAVTAETHQHTETGVLMGSVSYIAPELVTNEASDARADVYAVGVILYELLTGHKPHAGETPIQVAYKHVHADVPAPSLDVPGIPAYVDALVARATARDQALRPTDAGVLLRQVRMVGHALDNGVVDDPGLVADLALPAVATEDIEPTARLVTEPALRHSGTGRSETRSGVPAGRPQQTATMRMREPVLEGRVIPPGRVVPRSRRRRRGPLVLILLLLVVIAVAVGGWWFGFGRYTSAPSVLQLTPTAAASRLEAAGLHVRQTAPDYSDTVAKGLVMASDPGPGARVLHGGTVSITVSKGIEQYPVPDLAGKSPDDARDALGRIKMDVAPLAERWSLKTPTGEVIGTDPAAGTVLRPGTSVTVYVSKGPKPVEVANWVKKPADKAAAALKKQGLKVTSTQDFSDSVDKGDVISQSPGAGTFHQGDTISLTVSKGPQLVEIPGGLRGHSVSGATDKLTALGLHVVTKNSAFYAGVGLVISLDPGSGTMVPIGSTVTLSVF